MHVKLTSGPHTVRGLAQTLAFSKPAVTRALDRLSRLGHVTRQRDPRDRRSVLIEVTPAGSAFLQDLAQMVTDASDRPLGMRDQ